MIKIIKHIAILILSLITLAYILEVVYTQVYDKGAPRDKIAWLKQMNSSNYDYAIFGSSRCIHAIQPHLIAEQTNKKGLNLAMVSAGPLEVKLMVLEFFKKHRTKKVFVQVDYSHNDEEPNYLSRIPYMPYYNDETIYSEFAAYGKEYWNYKYIPFYRYQKFGPKIGFRNVALILAGKEGKFVSTGGYTPQNGHLTTPSPVKWNIKNTSNKHIKGIIELCKELDVELYFFTSPVYDNQSNMNPLNEMLPNYLDLSNSIKDINSFRDNTHLNVKGSEDFTQVFIETYLN